MEVLLAAADTGNNDFYDSVAALNDLKDGLTAEQRQRLSVTPRAKAGQNKRAGDYAGRLLADILEGNRK